MYRPEMRLRTFLKKLAVISAIVILVGTLLGFGAIALVIQWASRDLPNITRIADFNPPQATTVLAADGSVLGSLYHEKRYMVPLEQMARYIPMAVLAAEDDGFYRHEGIDPIAILRAFLVNLQQGSAKQGGSTITQQIIKQLLLTPERSYQRKIKEAILAWRLERHLTKDEILTIYLNQIYLGNHAYGMESAARTFFGKNASDITLAESAVLAGMPQAPSRYNPFRHPEAAKTRQMYVLGRLRTMGWISEEEYKQAVAEPLVYWTMPEGVSGSAGWYMEEVRRQLLDIFSEAGLKKMGINSEKYGEDFVYEAGLTVYTAMQPNHQESAGAALRRGLEETGKRQGWRGPVEKIPQEQIGDFAKKLSFQPLDLAGEAWVKGLVTAVNQNDATVTLGQGYTGHINIKNMSWARPLNPKIAGDSAPAQRDARKVLDVGDVVYVSAVKGKQIVADAKGKKTEQVVSFDPSKVVKGTPLDLALQQQPLVQGAIASIEPRTGDVVALIGGYQFGDSHFNRATQARRQPGSSFKPIVYSTAMDMGYTPSTMLLDAPFVHINEQTAKVWRPSNYEGGFKGPLPLHTALALSRNTCTVRVAQQVGMPNIIKRAKDLGLEPHFPNELAVSLGAVAVSPLNLTQAYTAFANQGWVCKPRFITKIIDAQGKEIYRQDPQHWQGITPQNAYIMASLLKEVVTSGTASRARVLNRPVGAKTGTTNDENDAWFIGFTPWLVTGVYVGFDQLQPLGRLEAGGRTAAPIFVYYRKEVESQYPPDDFTMPPGIVMQGGQPYREGEPISGTVQFDEGDGSVKGGEDLLKHLF